MPTLKEMDVRIWCPGPWPWEWADTCVRKRHRWCYQFDWLQKTGYLALTHYEGCENGRLYTWNEPLGGLGSGYEANVEMCLEDKMADEGRCDSSNIGMQTGGLSKSAPLAVNLKIETVNLESAVAETGTFEFTQENGGLCQQGLWDWKRTLHKQKITLSIDTRFATVQWYVAGVLLANTTGIISFSTFCTYPFPLPKGRSQNQIVHLRYEVITEQYKSTVNLFNDTADGNYSFPIEIAAIDVDNGNKFDSQYTTWNFKGETCDFDPAKVQELAKCLKGFWDVSNEKAKSKKPGPIDPEVRFSDEIWRYIRDDQHEVVTYLLDIIRFTFQDDQETFTLAVNQVETVMVLPGGIARLMKITAAPITTKASLDKLAQTKSNIALFSTGLLIGITIVGLASLVRDRQSNK